MGGLANLEIAVDSSAARRAADDLRALEAAARAAGESIDRFRGAPRALEPHFDLIALPKGQLPGGPIQASNGMWCLVVPANSDLSTIINMIVSMRGGNPVTDEEMQAAQEALAEKATD